MEKLPLGHLGITPTVLLLKPTYARLIFLLPPSYLGVIEGNIAIFGVTKWPRVGAPPTRRLNPPSDILIGIGGSSTKSPSVGTPGLLNVKVSCT